MKAFVTGGTGFIGGSLVPKLLARGYTVTCLMRNPDRAAKLKALNVQLLQGDVTDRGSLDAAQGHDVVFHLAGVYAIGMQDAKTLQAINVEGTRNALDAVHAHHVPRMVYASSIVALGDTLGNVQDETWHHPPKFPSIYERTKYEAHVEAEKAIAEGVPVIIVMPGSVYGPGDPSIFGQTLRELLKGRMPVMAGPNVAHSWVHVEDVAEGFILAAEKGKPGEEYLLAGDQATLRQVVQLWAELGHVAYPRLTMPLSLARVLAVLSESVAPLNHGKPVMQMLTREAIESMSVQSYLYSSAKAQRELGWHYRSVRAGFPEMVQWEKEHRGV